ncbi:MAG: class I SAM-dependent methyltransferase [Anaerolineae bacterium]
MGVPQIDYAEVWRDMLEAWGLPPEIAGQQPEPEKPEDEGDGWQHLALHFQRMAEQALEEPPGPLISRVLDRATAGTTVLDVGAGTGRQTLQLAPYVGRVIAVEPSPAMREFLADELEKRGLKNVELVPDRWQDAQVPVADIVVCANVLYDVQDLVPFLRKLDEQAREACFIEITFRHPLTPMNELWRRFQGIERPERPDYFDAVAVFHQMGIHANVQIERVPASLWYSDLDEAVESFRRRLHLEPDPQRDAELRDYVHKNSRKAQGRIYPGPPARRIVILWWEKEKESQATYQDHCSNTTPRYHCQNRATPSSTEILGS